PIPLRYAARMPLTLTEATLTTPAMMPRRRSSGDSGLTAQTSIIRHPGHETHVERKLGVSLRATPDPPCGLYCVGRHCCVHERWGEVAGRSVRLAAEGAPRVAETPCRQGRRRGDGIASRCRSVCSAGERALGR